MSVSGQNPAKKTPPKQAPAKVESSAAGLPLASLPTIKFEKYTLPNGLVVILSEDHRLPLVSTNIWYHVGPANELPGRTGFAHLFEHMMFEGSKHVPGNAHIRYLEAAGASDLNGTTDFDRTNYFETIPSNQLELALWLESDRMGYLPDKLDQASLTNQQDVVRNERRQSIENSPYGIVEEGVFHELFPKGHPYYADVMGSHADIQAAKLEDVRNFFKLYYAPNNASLAIVGDFDPAQAKTDGRKIFWTAQARRARAENRRRDAADHRGAPRGDPRSGGIAARVYGLADFSHFQARRRRGRSGLSKFWAAANPAACTRSSSTKSRSRWTSAPRSNR